MATAIPMAPALSSYQPARPMAPSIRDVDIGTDTATGFIMSGGMVDGATAKDRARPDYLDRVEYHVYVSLI